MWQEGLQAAAGRELVLARTKETALKLGKRRAPSPILVTIQAQAAAKSGITFTGYGEELFLATALPRDFLTMPAPPPPEEKPRFRSSPQQRRPPREPFWWIFPHPERQAPPAPRQKSRARMEVRGPGLKKTKGKRGKGERGKRIKDAVVSSQ